MGSPALTEVALGGKSGGGAAECLGAVHVERSRAAQQKRADAVTAADLQRSHRRCRADGVDSAALIEGSVPGGGDVFQAVHRDIAGAEDEIAGARVVGAKLQSSRRRWRADGLRSAALIECAGTEIAHQLSAVDEQ